MKSRDLGSGCVKCTDYPRHLGPVLGDYWRLRVLTDNGRPGLEVGAEVVEGGDVCRYLLTTNF